MMKVEGSYMSISYGTPENRVLHYKRQHLKLLVSTFEIAPEEKVQDAVSYNILFHCDLFYKTGALRIYLQEIRGCR